MIYLIPFLERDLLSSLPYIAASSLIAFPVEMHKEIMNYLIYHILPFAVREYFSVIFFLSICFHEIHHSWLKFQRPKAVKTATSHYRFHRS